MRNYLIFTIITTLSIGLITYFIFTKNKITIISPIVKEREEKPLDKYTFERLRKKEFKKEGITLGKIIKSTNRYISYIFYVTDGDKKISGLMNIPTKEGIHSIIALFRGYVDKEGYQSGIGTQNIGEYFAQNGYITLALDFLGYGESDNPSKNSIEERFQTYTSALSLMSSISSINDSLITADVIKVMGNIENIGIWGHSNGGHIALSTLAITGKKYPTVLWAPVSKPFPYSILFFTDDYSDNGKSLRKAVADFEVDYNIENYSPTNYYEWINAPIQLHQGTNDNSIPTSWSDTLDRVLKKQGVEISYFTYTGDDHNFSNNWNVAAQRSLSFFNEKL
ncbi:hypothetical protein LBMAG33_5800 [Candidatus Levyibacteriota bacterium]|nr:hypothetical protein LBMAG33_5800 [Candidatus Levybacteria bacterium]